MSCLQRGQPNFLIVGAARCGTTSLYRWLRQHPDVFMPERKEPCFFMKDFGITEWDEYLALFHAGQGRTAIGEASVQYLDSPEAPEWIRRKLGAVKILILLRHPVDRAVSLHAFNAMTGCDWIGSLREAIALEPQRIKDASFLKGYRPACRNHYLYAWSGLYYENVKRYLDVFGRDNVRVYLFDDLIADPGQVFADVCGFLGVSTSFKPVFTRENAGRRIPRWVQFQYCLYFLIAYNGNRIPYVSPLLAKCLYRLASWNEWAGKKSTIEPDLRHDLMKMYKPDLEQLAVLIGRDLSPWISRFC